MNQGVKVPIILVIFNRPDTTRRVFQEIARYRPERLFLVADGPRPSHPEDEASCLVAREIVSHVDWDCDVRKNFSDVNLGCGHRPVTGIDWAFEHVEEAIILEDDCVPHPDFFRFCEEMLARYRDESRIMGVSGHNLLGGRYQPPYSYFFYRHFAIWGWATWRRAWQHFDWGLAGWPELRNTRWLAEILGNERVADLYRHRFDRLHAGKDEDVWDFRWMYSVWVRDGMGLAPETNLVSNIGFDQRATHTKNSKHRLAALPTQRLVFPLRHPPALHVDPLADMATFATFLDPYRGTGRSRRVLASKALNALSSPRRSVSGGLRRARKAVRDAAYRHYGTARLYYRRELARRMASANDLVLVYQMGRVGGQAVRTSLQAARPTTLCCYVHWLTADRLAADEALFRRTWHRRLSWTPHGLWQCEFLRERVVRGGERDRWKIITLVGDPVARNVGVFFDILEYKLGFDYAGRVAADGLDEVVAELRDRFWTQFTKHQEPLTWFGTELREVFGIDVFASDFPKDRGYQVHRSQNADVLVLKSEMLSTCFKEGVQELLGGPPVPLVPTTDAPRREYAEAYDRFLETVSIPDAYLDEMYGSEYARHFYSPAELEGFRRRWAGAARTTSAGDIA